QNAMLRAQLDSMRAEVQALMAARRHPEAQLPRVLDRVATAIAAEREAAEKVVVAEEPVRAREFSKMIAESFESKDRSGLLSRLIEERDELLAKRESVDESDRKTLEAKLKDTVDWIARL